MANWYFAMVAVVMLAGGCHSEPTFQSKAPPPSFSGPMIERPKPVMAQVVTPAPAARVPAADAGVREWMPAGQSRPWRYIVIHHSATASGGARAFDRMHRDKGWDELGYHFVIGNGTETSNGLVEVGSRWVHQKWGAHTKTADNRYNDYGIGICLVGNFEMTRPTGEQMRSLARLVAHLMRSYQISADRVVGHSDCKPTDCPGRNMNLADVRRMATRMLADAGEMVPVDSVVWLALDERLGMQGHGHGLIHDHSHDEAGTVCDHDGPHAPAHHHP